MDGVTVPFISLRIKAESGVPQPGAQPARPVTCSDIN